MRGKFHEEEKSRIKPNSQLITKIEAAFRQLRTAVLLYFSDQDPVAIHTLAVAGHEILRQLAKRKGIAVGLDPSETVAAAPKLNADEAKAILSVSAGFFKHAGRYPDESMYFQPEINDHFLYEGVCLYEQITDELHSEFDQLRMIVTMRNPDLLPTGIPPEARARWMHHAEMIKQDTPANLLKRVIGLQQTEAPAPTGE